MEQVYINMKNRREELGMSQRELAAKCGYKDHTTIAKMEKGQVDATLCRIKQIAAALDISPMKLLGWEDDQ